MVAYLKGSQSKGACEVNASNFDQELSRLLCSTNSYDMEKFLSLWETLSPESQLGIISTPFRGKYDGLPLFRTDSLEFWSGLLKSSNAYVRYLVAKRVSTLWSYDRENINELAKINELIEADASPLVRGVVFETQENDYENADFVKSLIKKEHHIRRALLSDLSPREILVLVNRMVGLMEKKEFSIKAFIEVCDDISWPLDSADWDYTDNDITESANKRIWEIVFNLLDPNNNDNKRYKKAALHLARKLPCYPDGYGYEDIDENVLYELVHNEILKAPHVYEFERHVSLRDRGKYFFYLLEESKYKDDLGYELLYSGNLDPFMVEALNDRLEHTFDDGIDQISHLLWAGKLLPEHIDDLKIYYLARNLAKLADSKNDRFSHLPRIVRKQVVEGNPLQTMDNLKEAFFQNPFRLYRFKKAWLKFPEIDENPLIKQLNILWNGGFHYSMPWLQKLLWVTHARKVNYFYFSDGYRSGHERANFEESLLNNFAGGSLLLQDLFRLNGRHTLQRHGIYAVAAIAYAVLLYALFSAN